MSNSFLLPGNKNDIPAENGLDLLARLWERPDLSGLEPLLFDNQIEQGDVVEISGAPGVGKTLIGMHLIASALLPQSWRGLRLGGQDGGVLLVDTDLHFCILQLANMIERRIKHILKKVRAILKNDSCDKEELSALAVDERAVRELLKLGRKRIYSEIDNLQKSCLSKFTYLKCTDSSQFAITLLTLKELLISKTEVSLVVIDSLSAYYWYDRAFRADTWYSSEKYYNKMFKTFIAQMKELKVVLVCSRQLLFQKRAGKPKDKLAPSTFGFFKDEDPKFEQESYEYLGKEWGNSVKWKLNLSASPLVLQKLQEPSASMTPKVPDDKHVYYISVSQTQEIKTLLFTVHEEGIRWCTT
ncbi:X-ray repair cross complementing 2 [Oratosquilla oratoria]|uniref:X-ray repair cross complementing 2 n=1 Tax=Oratosquilla oratoria TaxID=337810 RepID=UPI003F75E7B8